MKLNIAIVAATKQELQPLKKLIKKQNNKINNIEFSFFYTGVGSMISCFFLTQLLAKRQFDYVFQVGIGGSFSKIFNLGDAVIISKEFLADLGVKENNLWTDVFDLGFAKANAKPFSNKALINKYCKKINQTKTLTAVGITVNTITTNSSIKNLYIKKYNAQVESMEGAALHYVCNNLNIPYIQIRGISNMVGERNKQKWQIKKAIENSNQLAYELLCQL